MIPSSLALMTIKMRHRPSFLDPIQSSLIYLLLLFLGHHLTEHVFTQYKTASITECAQYCVREISTCKSINYKSRHMNQDSSKNCQLNNVTKLTQPQNLVVNIDYNYYEPLIKVRYINARFNFCLYIGYSCKLCMKLTIHFNHFSNFVKLLHFDH